MSAQEMRNQLCTELKELIKDSSVRERVANFAAIIFGGKTVAENKLQAEVNTCLLGVSFQLGMKISLAQQLKQVLPVALRACLSAAKN